MFTYGEYPNSSGRPTWYRSASGMPNIVAGFFKLNVIGGQPSWSGGGGLQGVHRLLAGGSGGSALVDHH